MNPKVQIIAKDVFTPLLRSLDFRKSRYNFHRRVNDLVQIVNLQVSQDGYRFFVNIGWAFDAYAEIHQLPINEKPDISSCYSGNLGIGFRLEQLVDTRREWPIEVVSTIHVELYDAFAQVIPFLKKVDSLEAYTQSDWFRKSPGDKALIHYYHQEYELAMAEIHNYCCSLNSDPERINMPKALPATFIMANKLEKLALLLAERENTQ